MAAVWDRRLMGGGQGPAKHRRRWLSSLQKRFWLDTRVATPSPQEAEQGPHAVLHSGQGPPAGKGAMRLESGDPEEQKER